MRLNIRGKLEITFTLLIVVIFSIAAYMFISEKRIEIADDIYQNALAFSKLTAPDVADYYDLYLLQGGFVYFNREIQQLFDQNRDIEAISIVNYSGELLYDSENDTDRRYDGRPRVIRDEDLNNQIKSEYVSIKTFNGDLYFFKSDIEGNMYFVDNEENILEPFDIGTQIEYFVIPADEKYSVIYYMNYSSLEERVSVMKKRILYLVIFGIMLGTLLAVIISLQFSKPVKKLVSAAGRVAKGDFKARVNIRSKDELGFLGDTFNQMAKDLEISMDAKMYKERVTHELKLASQIQEELIPRGEEIPKIRGLEIVADLIPAEEIGGDMYDFLPVTNNKLLFSLGDVTGHGVPAGIVSSIASALFYGYSDKQDLKEIMINVNRVLKAKTMTNMFMTLCLMQWDSVTQKFYYSSAGHEQIIHYKAKEGKAGLSPAGGVALGVIPDVSKLMKVVEIPLEVGDYLFIYSDGIPEAWRNEKDQYGMDRFIQAVNTFCTLQSAEAVKDAVLGDLKKFVEGYKQMDDITIIVLKRVA